MLGGLHQPQMALRQGQVGVPRQAAEDGHLRHRLGARDAENGGVGGTPHPVEDDAGDRHSGAVSGEPAHHGGGRRRLGGGVDDQDDGPAAGLGEVRRRALAGDGAVEQAHDPLADDALGAVGEVGARRLHGFRTHGPEVQVDARTPGRRRVKGRVDVIGPHLGRRGGNPGLGEMTQQPEGEDRFPLARRRGADDHPARAVRFHAPTLKSAHR